MKHKLIFIIHGYPAQCGKISIFEAHGLSQTAWALMKYGNISKKAKHFITLKSSMLRLHILHHMLYGRPGKNAPESNKVGTSNVCCKGELRSAG